MNRLTSPYGLLMMSKAPELGHVKTRMQPHLSQAQSQQLHIALTQYCLLQWHRAALCPIDIWVGGEMTLFEQKIISPLNLSTIDTKPQWSLFPQSSGDLGARMSFAVKTSLATYSQGVVLVGSDCPFIHKDYLQQVFAHLDNGYDAVLGPALDGGYVLLALAGDYPSLFDNIDWGSARVYQETLARIIALDLRYQVMPALSDIDTPKDLLLLDQLNQNAVSDVLLSFCDRIISST
jgi:uncharacterized protein